MGGVSRHEITITIIDFYSDRHPFREGVRVYSGRQTFLLKQKIKLDRPSNREIHYSIDCNPVEDLDQVGGFLVVAECEYVDGVGSGSQISSGDLGLIM